MPLQPNPSDWISKVGPPFKHQVEGVNFLLSRPTALLADEMGSGKSRQFIDAAGELYRHKQIDTLLVISPSSVVNTWWDQLNTHGWYPRYEEEYSYRNTKLDRIKQSDGLHCIVTNYEFVRVAKRLKELAPQLKGRNIMAVFDESSYIKTHNAAQTVAAREIRKFARRAYLANGSPISNSLIDLYAPFAVLDKGIIGVGNWWAFRNRYCIMGGWKNKQITGYQHVEHLQRLLKPYILRRMKEDCLDLPPKLYNTVEVPLSEFTWRVYKELRDEMISWLDAQTPIMTMHAVVKLLRLSQLTSGLAGGLKQGHVLANLMGLPFDPESATEWPDGLRNFEDDGVRVISEEKHNYIANWFRDRIADQPNFRCILWTRFRREQELLEAKLQDVAIVMRIYGGQKKEDRASVIARFNQPSDRPVVLISQAQAGGIGLNLQLECSWAAYVSNDYNLLTRQQSEDRIHRPGQRASTVNYLDILATGPHGQKTIDHAIKKALEKKDAFALKTTAYWRSALAA